MLVAAAHGAFDIEYKAVRVGRVLFKVSTKQSEGVGIGGTVELASIEIVASGTESGTDGGKNGFVRESGTFRS